MGGVTNNRRNPARDTCETRTVICVVLWTSIDPWSLDAAFTSTREIVEVRAPAAHPDGNVRIGLGWDKSPMPTISPTIPAIASDDVRGTSVDIARI
jgi:hypothetical protein